jgi:fatty-acyl-CoA synthase
MFIEELEAPDFDSYDLSSLRTGIMAGAPCPVEVMRKVEERMTMPEILIAYGQTEASPATTMTATVGRVLPHQELKIVDPATGKTVSHDEPGEICFRGYQVMAGYDNLPEQTAEAVDEHGWLHSGDIGTMDADGYVRITGRIKNMIIRGGENIYPREIEEFLHTLDFVVDAQVVGVPDERLGEELVAFLRVHGAAAANPPTATELRELCRGQIAHFKIPRYWKLVDEYPMTITGKVQKFKLSEQAERELASGTLPDSKAGGDTPRDAVAPEGSAAPVS